MDVKDILKGLQAGLDAVEQLAPVAKAVGVPGVVVDLAKVAGGVLEVANNVQQRFMDHRLIADAADARQIQVIIARIGQINDKLAAEVQAS